MPKMHPVMMPVIRAPWIQILMDRNLNWSTVMVEAPWNRLLKNLSTWYATARDVVLASVLPSAAEPIADKPRIWDGILG